MKKKKILKTINYDEYIVWLLSERLKRDLQNLKGASCRRR